ncbi:MAG: pilus assembly protein TadG-related protein [Rhizobiaceae bacterium]
MIVHEFLRNRRGNFAMTLAIAIIPVVMSAGIAVDYSSVSRQQFRLQNAVDAATLAAGKEMATMKDKQVKSAVRKFLKANLDADDFKQIRRTKIKIDRKNNALEVAARAKMPANFGPIIGIKTLPYGAIASTGLAMGSLEAVLVLDNTGSMSVDGKIDALKNASTNFVNNILDLAGNGDSAKIGIVPFAEYVNVGTDKAGQPWLQLTHDAAEGECIPDQPTPPSSTCTNTTPNVSIDGSSLNGSGLSCTIGGHTLGSGSGFPSGFDIDGFFDDIDALNNGSNSSSSCSASSSGSSSSSASCSTTSGGNNNGSGGSNGGGNASQKGSFCPETGGIWHGCVGSRHHPKNLMDNGYGDRIPAFYGSEAGYEQCPTQLVELTDDKQKILGTINAMEATGNTYIPTGLIWGLRVLSSREPFAQAASKSVAMKKNIQKALILMSDGENTISKNPDSHLHDGSDYAQADAWTAKMCKSIKKQGITLYTLSFGTDISSNTKKLLKKCASSPAYFYDASNGDKLAEAFEDIAVSLTRLYLKK